MTEQNAEYVLTRAHTRLTDRDGHPVYIATMGERRLKVVVVPGTAPPLIITVPVKVNLPSISEASSMNAVSSPVSLPFVLPLLFHIMGGACLLHGDPVTGGRCRAWPRGAR